MARREISNIEPEICWKRDFASKNWDEALQKLLKAKDYIEFSITIIGGDEISDGENKRQPVFITPDGKKYEIAKITETKIPKFLNMRAEKIYLRKAIDLMKKDEFKSEWDKIKNDFSIPIESICYANGEIFPPESWGVIGRYTEKAKRQIRLFCHKWKIRGMNGWIPIIPTTWIEERGYRFCTECGAILSSSYQSHCSYCNSPKIVYKKELYIGISEHTTDEDFREIKKEWKLHRNTFFGQERQPHPAPQKERNKRWFNQKYKKNWSYFQIVKHSLKRHSEDFDNNLVKYLYNHMEDNEGWEDCCDELKEPRTYRKKFLKLQENFPNILKDIIEFHSKKGANAKDLIGAVKSALGRQKKKIKEKMN